MVYVNAFIQMGTIEYQEVVNLCPPLDCSLAPHLNPQKEKNQYLGGLALPMLVTVP